MIDQLFVLIIFELTFIDLIRKSIAKNTIVTYNCNHSRFWVFVHQNEPIAFIDLTVIAELRFFSPFHDSQKF